MMATSDFNFKGYENLMKDTFGDIVPQNLPAVTLTHDSLAVEKAIFTAIAERHAQEKANWSAVAFDGCDYGHHTLAMLSFKKVNTLPKLANWPTIQYPTSESEESKALEDLRSTL